MRFRFWLRGAMVLAAAGTLLWAGCSEDEPVQVDETPPVVAFVEPDVGQGLNISPVEVLQEVTLIAMAQDASGIDRVEFWCTIHGDTTSHRIGEDRTADEQGLYEINWVTEAYTTGTEGVIWAVAYDNLGNRGRTSINPSIRVINPLTVSAPSPDFVITPNSGGTVANTFRFDPTLTTDLLDELNRIKVRWDFDYVPGDPNPVWDVDTSQARADEIQTWTYSVPKTYTVRLQAWNSYYGQASEIAERELTVLPEFGEPHPPGPVMLIPAGTYPIGVGKRPGGNEARFNEDEMVTDSLYVTITANVFIDQYEVSNRLYVDFLNDARDSAWVEYDPASWDVIWLETGDVLIKLDSDITRVLYLDEETGFAVDDNVALRPVTGVTWYGAKHYCSRYGLRLPSEYEWEIAARGNVYQSTLSDAYIYPWTPSSTIDGTYANYRNSGDPFEATGNLRAECPVGSFSDVDSLMGSFPHANAIGPFGTYDQAGNISEWVNDWYVPDQYSVLRQKYVNTGYRRWPSDPESPRREESPSETKVTRGGNFYDSPTYLRVTRRVARDPRVGEATVGFRAAYTEFIQ